MTKQEFTARVNVNVNDSEYEHIEAAPSCVFLHFLNNAKLIFADLEAAQNNIMKDMTKALADTEGL